VRRVFIVHGWGGTPDEAWMPWLGHQLRQRGFRVESLAMPEPDVPKVEPWVATIAQHVGAPDAETFFVGHSIGCMAIMRYFQTIQETVGGAVFVAPWLDLALGEEDSPENRAIVLPWIAPLNDVQVATVCPRMVCIFSDDDQFVPLSNVEQFERRFNAKPIIEHGKGHFDTSSRVTELYSALNAFLLFTKNS
jgi:predicted alpha/beta hydrolase family esterase